MAEVDRILIVGGGIAGLSLATALYRQGYTPELVERSTAWPAVGAGINLPANGVRVLRALGVGEIVDRTAAVLRSWGFFDQQGALLCETDLEELWRDVGPCLAITRVRLQEALLTVDEKVAGPTRGKCLSPASRSSLFTASDKSRLRPPVSCILRSNGLNHHEGAKGSFARRRFRPFDIALSAPVESIQKKIPFSNMIKLIIVFKRRMNQWTCSRL